MKAFPLLTAACLLFTTASSWADGSDNFNDNSKDPAKWGTDDTSGHGVLTEAGQQLRYSCNNATVEDEVDRPWNLTRFPYNADWEILVEAVNNTTPVPTFQVNSMGITLESPLDAGDYLYHELYNSALGGPARIGTNADMTANGVSQGGGDSSTLTTNAVLLRMVWNSTTKVLTCYYDIDPSDANNWITLASFGLSAAGGGADANADWGLADTDRFFISVYGYSSLMTVPAGQMHLDNFSETGGIVGGTGTRPEPVGNFNFPFPTGNPLLTKIASITGNYHGTSPTVAQRPYDVDVAQDESGKIMAMGTIEGVEDANGNSEIGGQVGSVRTVNEEPVAQLKGSFKGTVDDATVSFKGSGSGPVELVDVGGDPGVAGTTTYSMKVDGVPFSGKNVAVEYVAPPGAEDNLKIDWNLQLDIAAKTVGGKERIVASAILVLPNGDSVAFPERVVKYSEAKGYKLVFKKGTNTTANPDRLDKKTSIILTGLKFVKNGDDWEPTAGTINYSFLGQKGIEDLTEFLVP